MVKLSPTGVQLAVFTASSPALRIPTGLYLESDGSLLIVDNANERVVQLNATGAQTAAYFDRQVLLSWPTSITMDVAGFYYIADSENARVVKLDSSGAQVAEFTTSNPSLYEPTAVVVDAGGCLYICDKGNDRIVKLNSTGAQMAVFTTNNPQLGAPLAVSLDAHGDLFILDPLNFRVVKLNQSGHQVAMFTTRDPTLRDPEGMLVTPDGTMYISDSGHQRVVQLNSAGVQLNMWVDPWLEDPHGLALDSDGSVYVASAEFGCILKLSHNGTLLYRYVASSPPLEAPTGLMLDASGNLFVANSAYNRIVVFVNPYCKHGHHCPFRTPILCPARFYCPTPQYVQSVAAPTILLCPPRHYCSPGTVEPEECWEKHFCAAGSVEPLPCPAGYYCPAGSDDPTAEHCKAANTTGCGLICPAGSYCPYMSATPTPCPQFTYGDQQGLTNDSCSGHCPNGTYSVRDAPAAGRNSTNCSGLCTLGQYCPWEAEQPLLCPGGSYCPNTTSLLSCKDGYYGDRTGLTVDTCSGPCDAGFICTTNSITPRQLPCPPGQYNNRTGQGKCENCPRGSYAESSANGTQKCTECPIGQHSPREGAVSCQYCPAGQFNNQTGRTECSTCPAGTQAATEAENRTSCSPCPLGYVSIAGTCEPCPRSTYSLLNSSSQCMSCAGIAGVECDGGIAYIDQLWHAAVVVQRRSILNGSSGELEAVLITQRCPVGYCVGVDSSAFSDIILPSAGSTGAAGGDATAVVFPLTGQCSDNRDQSAGTSLCGGCAAGYAAPDVGSPQSGCVRCTGTSYGKIAMLLLTTWLLVLLYYVTSNGRLGLIGCFLYYMQTIAIMVSSQSSLTAWVRTFGFSPVSLMPAACWGTGMSPELQYAMPLLIVPLQLLQLVVTVAVHAALIRYCKPAEYALDELSMTYVRSGDGDERRQQAEPLDDVHERWYQRYARLLQQRVVTLIRYRLWPELTVSTVVRTGFLIVTASFTSIIVTCVSWFSCTADMTMGVTGKSGSVVYAFPAVPCYTSRYYGWSWMMGGCILLWLLATVAASCWLFRHRRQLAALQRRSPLVSGVPVDSMRTFSSLALRPEVASQLVDGELRVTLMRHAPFAWYWPSANAINAWDEPVCDSGVDGVVMESRREYAFRSIYGALYDSFRTEASGWIVVVWLRRLLLIVLSVALTTSPSARYLSFLLLHLIIYCLQGYFEPFATQALNHAERVSILVHVVIASVLLAYPSPSDAAVQSAVLTLTLAPLVLYLVYRQAQRYVLRTSRRSTKARVRVRNEALSVKLLQSDEVEL